MAFAVFILVNAILFIRPTDFVADLDSVPLYEIAVIGCILVSWNKLLGEFSIAKLSNSPITVLALGIFFASVISNLANGRFQVASDFALDFGKVILYYLLVVALLDSPSRLRMFLVCLVGGIDLIPTSLALLQYHGLIDIPAFTAMVDFDSASSATGEFVSVRRLHGSGLFGDPNDVCEILSSAFIFCLYGLTDRRSGRLRSLWLLPMCLFSYALSLTQSRGGLLGAMAGLAVLFWTRFGKKKTILLGLVVLPAALALFGGRQTSMGTSQGTGQQRIQIWSTGFEMMRRSPLWGIGTDQFRENVGLVAHNSFIHAYTELGFLGGTLFFGMFYHALWTMRRLGSSGVIVHDPEMRRVRPYIMAAVASFAVSQMSLSQCYAVPTYTMLALGTVCIGLSHTEKPLSGLRVDGRFFLRLAAASTIFLMALFLFVKVFVRWS